jgi:hypothetical protein
MELAVANQKHYTGSDYEERLSGLSMFQSRFEQRISRVVVLSFFC